MVVIKVLIHILGGNSEDLNMDLIVFDKDSTLTKTITGQIFPSSPEDQKLRFDMSVLPPDNYYAIASNQKGVLLGHKSRDFLEAEFAYLEKLTQYYFFCMAVCPDNGETILIRPSPGKKFIHFHSAEMFKSNIVLEGCQELMGTFRKPQPGMLCLLEQIARWTPSGVRELDRKIYIGDMDTDCQAAASAGFEYWDIEDWLWRSSQGKTE